MPNSSVIAIAITNTNEKIIDSIDLVFIEFIAFFFFSYCFYFYNNKTVNVSSFIFDTLSKILLLFQGLNVK
jgi:hypothetical protein